MLHVRVSLLSLVLVACGAPNTAATPAQRPTSLIARSDVTQVGYTVVATTGDTEFREGDRIVIREIRGTASTFELGGTYRIQGHYSLASADRATLLASITAASNSGPAGAQDEAHVSVARGAGEFVLEFKIETAGYPHVTFYGPDGHPFGGVYFGSGEWLLPNKGWSYFAPSDKRPRDSELRSFELL